MKDGRHLLNNLMNRFGIHAHIDITERSKSSRCMSLTS
jgi:hypothetical protein